MSLDGKDKIVGFQVFQLGYSIEFLIHFLSEKNLQRMKECEER